MARFRFRAQVALDLRQKQEEEAQRALGAARQARAVAAHALEHEERVLAEANTRAAVEEARAWDPSRAVWYRNWMKGQKQVIAAAHAVLETRRQEERAAAERAMEARRRARALERLRDRAWKAFQVAERRSEQKEFDMLGGLRYAARQHMPEGA
jgi:flagellar export protein FliJ